MRKKKIKYTILHTDGRIETFKTSKEWTLKKMQSVVGGYIELISQPERFRLSGRVYVNENGKILNLPVNPLVTATGFDALVGNILIEEAL